MAGWGGFSEEDLNRLKKHHLKSAEFSQEPDEKPENVRKANFSAGPKRQKPREKIKTKPTTSKREPNVRQDRAVEKTSCETTRDTSEVKSIPEGETSRDNTEVEKIQGNENEINEQEEKVPEIIMEPERIQEIELTTLQKMQQKQKEIEDQNKKKKAALQETIRTRFKRTQAEANTLKYVHKELAHLDNLLSADVAVLRDTIEEATREYHYALKRYEHAEGEFVAAKLDLHRKTERKEMLTEHLLAVIQQNEERKARKLEELMAKLDVSDEVLEENISKINHNTNTGKQSETNGNKMEKEKLDNDDKNILVETIKDDELNKVTEKENTSQETDESKNTLKEDIEKNVNPGVNQIVCSSNGVTC